MICQAGLSQTRDHIILSDTISFGGQILFNYENPYIVRHKKPGSNVIKTYMPRDISRFVYEGKTFYPKQVIEKDGSKISVFLEAIEQGDVKLYYSPIGIHSFYWEKDTFLPLPKNNYLNILESLSEQCNRWENQYKNVNYSKNSLLFFFENYNKNKCINIPYVSFGLSINYSFSTLHMPADSYNENLFGDYEIDAGFFSFGFYGDYLLWDYPKYRILYNISFGKPSYSKELKSPIVRHDVKFDYNFLYFDLSYKYVFNTKTFRPYFNIGPAAGYADNTSSYMYHVSFNPDAITGRIKEDFTDFSPFHYGFTAGVGVEYHFQPRRHISLQFGTSRLYNTNHFKIINNTLSLKINLWLI